MKLPQNYHSRIHSLSIAIVGLLESGRHSGTEEISALTKNLMDGPKVVLIPTPDPEEVTFKELKRWKARHPGYTLKVVYPHKTQLDLPEVQLKNIPNQRFRHKGRKRDSLMFQPNNQVPKRVKQDGLEEGLNKLKSPYR